MCSSRVCGAVREARTESRLNDEIQAHLALLVEENLRAGMSIEDARAAARREFGGVDQIKEAYRDQRGLPFVETIAQDIRYAMRTFRRSPGFVIAVVLSLSLGIGVNSAVFTVLNALMLRSLPVDNPQELFVVVPQGPTSVPSRFSYPAFEELRRATSRGPAAGELAAMSRVAVSGALKASAIADDRRSTGIGRASRPQRYAAHCVLTEQDNLKVGRHPVADQPRVLGERLWR
jgi:hypothetical protein